MLNCIFRRFVSVYIRFGLRKERIYITQDRINNKYVRRNLHKIVKYKYVLCVFICRIINKLERPLFKQ